MYVDTFEHRIAFILTGNLSDDFLSLNVSAFNLIIIIFYPMA